MVVIRTRGFCANEKGARFVVKSSVAAIPVVCDSAVGGSRCSGYTESMVRVSGPQSPASLPSLRDGHLVSDVSEKNRTQWSDHRLAMAGHCSGEINIPFQNISTISLRRVRGASRREIEWCRHLSFIFKDFTPVKRCFLRILYLWSSSFSSSLVLGEGSSWSWIIYITALTNSTTIIAPSEKFYWCFVQSIWEKPSRLSDAKKSHGTLPYIFNTLIRLRRVEYSWRKSRLSRPIPSKPIISWISHPSQPSVPLFRGAILFPLPSMRLHQNGIDWEMEANTESPILLTTLPHFRQIVPYGGFYWTLN